MLLRDCSNHLLIRPAESNSCNVLDRCVDRNEAPTFTHMPEPMAFQNQIP